LSRQPRKPRTTVKPSSSATGQQLLNAFAGLGKGMKHWLLASMPTDNRLTVPRATLLFGLNLKREPVGMSEIGETLGMSPRNMTVLVDGLAKEGLVRRIDHPHDRRIKLVELTAAGKQVAEKELGPARSTAATLFNDLSAKERTELLQLLDKVAEALRARGIDVTTGE
jgi:DNA-binding MarR family transcriptional regulator